MPAIGDITYKSDIKEFIDYSKVEEQTESIKKVLKNIDTNIITTLDTQINGGGLDLYTVNINGVPIYHNKAIEIEQGLNNICADCTTTLNKINLEAKKHRSEELNQYITKLTNRIKEQEDNYAAAEERYNMATAQIDNLTIGERLIDLNYGTYVENQAFAKSDMETIQRDIDKLKAKKTDAETALQELGA